MKTNNLKSRTILGTALVLTLSIPHVADAAALAGRNVRNLPAATSQLGTRMLAQLELSIADRDVRQLLGMMRVVAGKTVLNRDVLLDNNNPGLRDVGRIPIPANLRIERVQFSETYTSSFAASFAPPGTIGYSGLGVRSGGFAPGTISGGFNGTVALPSGLSLAPLSGVPVPLTVFGSGTRIGDHLRGDNVTLSLGSGNQTASFNSQNFSIGRNGASQGTFTGIYRHFVSPNPTAAATINYGATLLVPGSISSISSPISGSPISGSPSTGGSSSMSPSFGFMPSPGSMGSSGFGGFSSGEGSSQLNQP